MKNRRAEAVPTTISATQTRRDQPELPGPAPPGSSQSTQATEAQSRGSDAVLRASSPKDGPSGSNTLCGSLTIEERQSSEVYCAAHATPRHCLHTVHTSPYLPFSKSALNPTHKTLKNHLSMRVSIVNPVLNK